MIQATITELTKDGWKEAGVITASDGTLSYEPESEMLAGMCGEPILSEAGDEIEPSDAEAFVKALPFQFHGSYLRASLKEGKDADRDEG